MKVKIYRNCQPKSKVYSKGEADLPANEALELIGLGLAEKVQVKRQTKVEKPQSIKNDKDS